MSGSYPDVNAPSVAVDAAAAAAQVAAAVARSQSRQVQSASFMSEHGAAVLGGHATVDVVPSTIGG